MNDDNEQQRLMAQHIADQIWGVFEFLFKVLFIVGFPFGIIATLNQLFNTGILYTWQSWLAAAFIMFVLLIMKPKDIQVLVSNGNDEE